MRMFGTTSEEAISTRWIIITILIIALCYSVKSNEDKAKEIYRMQMEISKGDSINCLLRDSLIDHYNHGCEFN